MRVDNVDDNDSDNDKALAPNKTITQTPITCLAVQRAVESIWSGVRAAATMTGLLPTIIT